MYDHFLNFHSNECGRIQTKPSPQLLEKARQMVCNGRSATYACNSVCSDFKGNEKACKIWCLSGILNGYS